MTAIIAYKAKSGYYHFIADSLTTAGNLRNGDASFHKVESIASVPGLYVATAGTVSFKDVLSYAPLYQKLRRVNEESLNRHVYPAILQRMEKTKLLPKDDNGVMSSPFTAIYIYKTHAYYFRLMQGFVEIHDATITLGSGRCAMDTSLALDKGDASLSLEQKAIRAMEAAVSLIPSCDYPFYDFHAKEGKVYRHEKDGSIAEMDFASAHELYARIRLPLEK